VNCDAQGISGADAVISIGRYAGTLAVAVALAVCAATVAIAGEPRPWLCRDKPVFSDTKAMQYQVASNAGSWQIFFMQFEMNAAHDGFSIKDSRMLDRQPQSGTLPAGQYYAVALYRRGSTWICGYGEESTPPAGTLSKLCYSTDSDPTCQATLSVHAK
jgi:hypothetical protein